MEGKCKANGVNGSHILVFVRLLKAAREGLPGSQPWENAALGTLIQPQAFPRVGWAQQSPCQQQRGGGSKQAPHV